MMLELQNITIGDRIRHFSLTVGDGQLVALTGAQGSGKTTLLRAVLGLIPIDEGLITVDGELLTPRSAPYFRRHMAYVPQYLEVPQGYDGMGLGRWADLSSDERYLLLLTNAVQTYKPLLIVDQPQHTVSSHTAETIGNLLRDAVQRGTTVLAVTPPNTPLQIPNIQQVTL